VKIPYFHETAQGIFWAPFFARSRAKKPGFPLQVLGFAHANPAGFPLQSLARHTLKKNSPRSRRSQKKNSTRRIHFFARQKMYSV
jgi:hypothetical protein